MEWWPMVVFGWPAVVLVFATFVPAFVTRLTWLGFVGAAIGAPFCFYVSGFPLLYWVAFIAVGANFVAAYLLVRGRAEIAFAALVPFMLITATLAVFALRGIRLLRG